jgi:hypothetical protein
MGSMDCLTTVIGSLYYCTRELNPLLSGLVSSNIWGFIFVKLSVTVFVALMFILAQKTLTKSPNKNSEFFKIALWALRVAYFSIILFFVVSVANNLWVLFNIIK